MAEVFKQFVKLFLKNIFSSSFFSEKEIKKPAYQKFIATIQAFLCNSDLTY